MEKLKLELDWNHKDEDKEALIVSRAENACPLRDVH